MNLPFILDQEHTTTIFERETDLHLKRRFGFVSDPKRPKWHKIKQGIHSMDLQLVLQDPRTKSFHNICDSLTPQTRNLQLLGLILKFYLQRQLQEDCLHNTLERITKDLCLRFALKHQERFKENNGEYNLILYISSDFKPFSADNHVELQLHSFALEYTRALKKHLDSRRKLLFYKEHALHLLQQDARFRIVATEKNMGPAIMELENYKNAMIKEHLDTKSFKQIFESDARLIIELSLDEAKKLTITEGYLESVEHIFFERAFKKRLGEPSSCMDCPKFTNHHSGSDLLNYKQTALSNSALCL
jgi:hypothetical protein